MMYKSKFKEYEDYKGGHKAPVNDGYNAPLYDVTLNGHHSLNSKFKILTKEVKASQLWTDGNSINEWGYDV